MSFTTHHVTVRRETIREQVIEIVLQDGESAVDPENLALLRAMNGHWQDWQVVKDLTKVTEVKACPTELIANEQATEGSGRKWFHVVGRSDVPDNVWRYADVIEVAGKPGVFRLSVHEMTAGQETWCGGKILWDLDTTSWRTAKSQARNFVRRTLNP